MERLHYTHIYVTKYYYYSFEFSIHKSILREVYYCFHPTTYLKLLLNVLAYEYIIFFIMVMYLTVMKISLYYIS